MLLRSRIWFSVILLFVSSVALAQKSLSENDLKKKAEKSFNDQKYDDAVPLYSQLLSVYPQNPLYNYRYGVCLLYSGKDKSQAATYLEAAAKAPKPAPEVYYYLGRTYMYGNHFFEAIDQFNKFKKEGSSSEMKSFNVDMLIANCNNAIELNKDRRNVSIIDHHEESRSSFYSSYDLSNASGKLLTATDNFLTPKDKEKKNVPVMFMNKENTMVFYASYGKKGESGKDIYKAVNLGNGQWSEPVNLGSGVNSIEDEDFPYLDKDGKTLYFCSKGHNSMGGYDIFKSVLDLSTGEWSVAVNIGVPVNTVEDDLLYVPSHAGDEATYATAIESQTGTIEVRHIRLGDVVPDESVIKGIFVSQDQVMRKEARITVLRESSHEIITSINTNPRTGEYELMLPPGEDYIMVVEGGGYVPHAQNFRLPEATAGVSLKQKVVMDRKDSMEEMTVNNFFLVPSGSATADNDKPSEVKVSAVSTRDVDTTKIKPITIDGKAVYVALPTLLQTPDDKNAVANQGTPKSSAPDSETSPADNVSANEPKDADAKGEVAEGATNNTTANEGTKNAPTSNGNPNNNTGAKTQGGGTKAGAVVAAPVSTEKVSNAEAVKMSFDDAFVLKEEAATLKVKADQKQATADSLSSLSVQQKTQSEQLMSNDSVAGSRLAQESKANAALSGSKKTEAFAMAKLASNKQKEADRAFSESKQLMTQMKVDTNSTAYQSASKPKPSDEETATSSNDKTSQSTQKEGSEQTGNNPGTQPIAVNGAPAQSADNTSKHPEETEAANATPLNPHLETANRLQAESEDLSAKSYEKNQAALNTADKKEKEQLQKEAKDLKKQSDAKRDESAKEAQLAEKEEKLAATNPSSAGKNADAQTKSQETNTPQGNNTGVIAAAAVNPRYEKANELKQESVELAAQSDEKKQKGYSTTDKNEQATLLNESKDLKKQSEAKRKESEKEFALAQKEDKNQPKTATVNIAAAANTKPADQTKTGEGNSSTNPDNNGGAGIAAAPLAINDKKESPAVEETNSGNANGTAAREKAADEIVKAYNVAPEAATHYVAYTEKDQQSEATKKQADVIGTKILILQNGQEKDSLVEAANELNKQSIIQWQEGQKELAQAKAFDPTVEEKMASAVKGTEDGGQVTGGAAQTAAAGKQADNSQANVGSSKVEDGKQVADNSKPDVGSSKLEAGNTAPKENANGSTAELTTNNSQPTTGSQPTISNLELDTTRPEYPQYVAVQKQITVKQDETVNVFIEGMQVNKKAMAEKEQEIKLRDRAEVEKNPNKKETLLAQADSVKVIADSLTEVSKDKLAQAQENTRTVSALTTQSDELKSKLVIDKSTARVAGGDASVKGQSQGNEVANNAEKKTEDTSAKQQGGNTGSTTSDNGGQLVTADKKENSSEKTGNQTASASKPGEKTDASTEPSSAGTSSPDASPAKTGSPSSSEGTTIIPVNYSPTDVSTFELSSKRTSNEITMDPALPEGLIFKVQIGAFKTPLTADAFGGLQPLNGESSRPGWIRYCLGQFRSFEPANLLKKQVRAMGYHDAFVVAYFNGKRISLTEAYAMVGKATTQEKQAYASVTEMEFKHLSKYKMLQSDFDGKADEDSKSFYGTTETVSKDLIEYTVQVGAYKTSKTPAALTSLLPLNAEKTATGLYRFTTGRYDAYASADSMKKVAVTAGVKDAFICVYKGGTKMPESAMREFLKTAKTNSSSSVSTTSSPAPKEPIAATTNPTPEPVTKAVDPPANEISASDIIFKIQLGAFKETVPTAMVNSFLQLADEGITQEDDSRGFLIYYAGQYKSYDDAVAGKSNAVAKGLKDAFIVPFAKGKRISVAVAQKALAK